MRSQPNLFLLTAAILNALVAVLHVACAAFGASWYRLLGAGKEMGRMAEAGRWYPAVLTLGIAVVFGVWSLYALAGADVILRLPRVRIALCLITAIYLLRGVGWLAVMRYVPDDGLTFWIWSSSNSFAIGVVHLVGLRQVWSRL